jgi:hypothetical protein
MLLRIGTPLQRSASSGRPEEEWRGGLPADAPSEDEVSHRPGEMRWGWTP